MKRFIAFGVIPAIVLIGTMPLLQTTINPQPPTVVPKKEIAPATDIRTVVQSSISSVQKQSQLLVLTARMNATATTTATELGMEAWQIDVVTAEAQYLVDLKQIHSKNILIDGKEVTILIPKSALIVKQLPVVHTESRDNDSWLFTWRSEVKGDLVKENQKKISKILMSQALEQKDTAFIQAKEALGTLFNTPIKAAGLTHRVTIMFQ